MLRFGWVRGAATVLNPSHWESVAGRELLGTPFQSLGWQSAWYQAFGKGSELFGLQVFEGKDLVAYWTFLRSGGPCRTLVPLGVRGSDYLPPRIVPEVDVWPIILEALGQISDIDLVNLRRLREDQIPNSLNAESTCLLLDLPRDYETYEAGLSKSLRVDIKRGKSLKIQEGDENLEILFHLHSLRWKKRGWPGAFLPKARIFHRNLNIERTIYTIWQGGEPLGALYALHDSHALSAEGATYFYQSGFDPAHSKLSPGSVLIAHAIRQAIERGHSTFDFLRGDEAYKRRWKPTRALASGGLLLPITPIGRAQASLLGVVSKVEASARARLEGKSLLSGPKMPNAAKKA